MRYIGSRGHGPARTLSETLTAVLPADGELFVPAEIPAVDPGALAAARGLVDTARALLAPWFEGDPLGPHLDALCETAFTFDAPLATDGAEGDLMLELFHGPSAAFKDFGARFLGAALAQLADMGLLPHPARVLVATSGDTGAAVAAAMHGLDGVEVHVLHPRGRVSARQAHVLGSFGGNVRSYAVEGTFDDCQRMAKALLGDPGTAGSLGLVSANSISLGRLLPQMSYYAEAARRHRARGASEEPLAFVVPSGNLGNGVAAVWARAAGAPVGTIAVATNANRAVVRFLESGEVPGGRAVPTLANAMDVAVPSNLERLRWTYGRSGGGERWRQGFPAESFDDDGIRAEVLERRRDGRALVCPHTATASALLRRLRADGWTEPAAVVATAHPAKFSDVLEPLLGTDVLVPPALAKALERPSRSEPLAASPHALAERIDGD